MATTGWLCDCSIVGAHPSVPHRRNGILHHPAKTAQQCLKPHDYLSNQGHGPVSPQAVDLCRHHRTCKSDSGAPPNVPFFTFFSFFSHFPSPSQEFSSPWPSKTFLNQSLPEPSQGQPKVEIFLHCLPELLPCLGFCFSDSLSLVYA